MSLSVSTKPALSPRPLTPPLVSPSQATGGGREADTRPHTEKKHEHPEKPTPRKTDTMKKHITIVTSPEGEEWYEAYGPLTKDRSKATEFFTNELTLRPPERFGLNGTAFWGSEREAEALALKKYKGWTHRHEPITD